MKDICCIGHITHDRIVTPGHSVDMAGGTSFYFSYGINHLPQEVSYQLVTKIGPDSEAEVERMRKAGIDVKQFNCPHSVFLKTVMASTPTTAPSVCLPKPNLSSSMR